MQSTIPQVSIMSQKFNKSAFFGGCDYLIGMSYILYHLNMSLSWNPLCPPERISINWDPGIALLEVPL